MTIVIDKNGNRLYHTSILVEEKLHREAKAAGISLKKTLDTALREELEWRSPQ